MHFIFIFIQPICYLYGHPIRLNVISYRMLRAGDSFARTRRSRAEFVLNFLQRSEATCVVFQNRRYKVECTHRSVNKTINDQVCNEANYDGIMLLCPPFSLEVRLGVECAFPCKNRMGVIKWKVWDWGAWATIEALSKLKINAIFNRLPKGYGYQFGPIFINSCFCMRCLHTNIYTGWESNP